MREYHGIPNYVFHTTSPPTALKILIDGYLKPSAGIISFTRSPFFGSTVYSRGITFVFPENIIIEKYGGKEVEPDIYELEEEIFVENRLVYIEDATEILTERDVARKYGFGLKYPYKDVRYRLGTPWRAFRELAPTPPWEGLPKPRLFR